MMLFYLFILIYLGANNDREYFSVLHELLNININNRGRSVNIETCLKNYIKTSFKIHQLK